MKPEKERGSAFLFLLENVSKLTEGAIGFHPGYASFRDESYDFVSQNPPVGYTHVAVTTDGVNGDDGGEVGRHHRQVEGWFC